MHLKLKDFESLIDCNCQNSWDKNLICTELCSQEVNLHSGTALAAPAPLRKQYDYTRFPQPWRGLHRVLLSSGSPPVPT